MVTNKKARYAELVVLVYDMAKDLDMTVELVSVSTGQGLDDNVVFITGRSNTKGKTFATQCGSFKKAYKFLDCARIIRKGT